MSKNRFDPSRRRVLAGMASRPALAGRHAVEKRCAHYYSPRSAGGAIAAIEPAALRAA